MKSKLFAYDTVHTANLTPNEEFFYLDFKPFEWDVTIGTKPVMIVPFVFELSALGTRADTMSFFFFFFKSLKAV